MKRSEVVEFISGQFEVGLDFDSVTRAENLLCHLEQMGLTHPWSEEEDDDGQPVWEGYGFKNCEVVFFEPSYSNKNEWNKKYSEHPLRYGDRVYYLGEIPNVPGHCLVFKRGTGIVDMIHPGDLRKAKEEEL